MCQLVFSEVHVSDLQGCVFLYCLQIYTLFLTAGANAVSSWSEPASWAVALQEGLQAIMRCVGLLRQSMSLLQALAVWWPATRISHVSNSNCVLATTWSNCKESYSSHISLICCCGCTYSHDVPHVTGMVEQREATGQWYSVCDK